MRTVDLVRHYFRLPPVLSLNGNFEVNATGWTAGPAFAQALSTEQAAFGGQSLKLTKTGDGTEDDTNATSAALTAAGSYPHALSVYVYIPSSWDGGEVSMRLDGSFSDASGVSNGTTSATIRDAWQRITTLVTPASDLSGSAVIRVVSEPTGADKFFYVDGIQWEVGTSASPYRGG